METALCGVVEEWSLVVDDGNRGWDGVRVLIGRAIGMNMGMKMRVSVGLHALCLGRRKGEGEGE